MGKHVYMLPVTIKIVCTIWYNTLDRVHLGSLLLLQDQQSVVDRVNFNTWILGWVYIPEVALYQIYMVQALPHLTLVKISMEVQ